MSGALNEAELLTAGAAELLVDVDDDAADRLLRYLDLLYAWNDSTRLTAISRADAVRLHLLDCLACIPDLSPGCKLVDLGSGPGLPGLVIATVRADVEVTLVEAKRKRCSFLHEAIGTLGLSGCRVLEADAASVAKLRSGHFDVVTARAFRSPPQLVELAGPILRSGGSVLIMCGGDGLEGENGDAVRACATILSDRSFVLPGGDERRSIVVVRPRGGSE